MHFLSDTPLGKSVQYKSRMYMNLYDCSVEIIGIHSKWRTNNIYIGQNNGDVMAI